MYLCSIRRKSHKKGHIQYFLKKMLRFILILTHKLKPVLVYNTNVQHFHTFSQGNPESPCRSIRFCFAYLLFWRTRRKAYNYLQTYFLLCLVLFCSVVDLFCSRPALFSFVLLCPVLFCSALCFLFCLMCCSNWFPILKRLFHHLNRLKVAAK